MFRSRVISGLLLRFIARRRVNVLSADLPDPRDPLYICGARVLEVFPLVNLIGDTATIAGS